MSTDRPPTNETTARPTPPPPAPGSNMLLQRGRDDLELYEDGKAVARELAWTKIYPEVARQIIQKCRRERVGKAKGPHEIGLAEIGCLALISDHANVEDGRLVIELTTSEIGELLGMDASSAKRMMGRLARYGLISHERETNQRGQMKRGLWVVHSASGVARFGLNRHSEPRLHLAPEVEAHLGGELAPEVENACSEPQVHDAPEAEDGQLMLADPASVVDMEPRTPGVGKTRSDHSAFPTPVDSTTSGETTPIRQEGVVVDQEDEDNNSIPEPDAVARMMRAIGVRSAMTVRLLTDKGEAACYRQVVWLKYRGAEDPAAMLVRAIQEDWDEPKELVERRRRDQEEARRRQDLLERERREQDEARRDAEIDRLVDELPEAEWLQVEREVVAELEAAGEMSASLISNEVLLRNIVRGHLRQKIVDQLDQAA
jgi:DNA-binding MarR family transcriptional regulator